MMKCPFHDIKLHFKNCVVKLSEVNDASFAIHSHATCGNFLAVRLLVSLLKFV